MKKEFIFISFLFIATAVVGQVSPPPPVPPAPPTPPPAPGPASSAPLDPFSWIMLGAGGAAAAGKYYKSKKK